MDTLIAMKARLRERKNTYWGRNGRNRGHREREREAERQRETKTETDIETERAGRQAVI